MYMDERFGAWQVGENLKHGPVEFKVFFPDRAIDPSQYTAQPGNAVVVDYGDPKIVSLQVAGNFQRHLNQADWDFAAAPHLQRQAHAHGWQWVYQTPIELPAGYYEYKYFVTFENGTTRKVSDPCARYGGRSHQNAAFTIGGRSRHTAVRPIAGGRKPLRDLVVYELMIDDFTDEYRGIRAPIEAVRDRLDYLKDELGVNAILFMPWTAWPGDKFSWGYTPYLYFSVEYRYANALGRPADKLVHLKQLIDDCHARGLHVIMDGVFNHVGDIAELNGVADGFPYRWLYQDPDACPYIGLFGGSFPGLRDLDFHNDCTQTFIRDVCCYWIDDFQIDGIRFDNTVNFYIPDDIRGLPRLLAEIDRHVTARGETNFSLTLEHLDITAARVVNGTCATSYWNNALYQACFEALWNGRIQPQLVNALNTHAGLEDDKVATTYLTNHDHSHLAWQAGARRNLGGMEWYRTQPYVIALLTSPGTPLILNGQEFAEDYWLMEDDEGSGRRVQARPMRWDRPADPIGAQLLKIYKKLIAIRRAHAGLRSNNFYPAQWEDWMLKFNSAGYGVDVDQQVLIYHRWGAADNGRLERFSVVVNFSDEPQTVDVPFADNGPWRDLLNDRDLLVTDFVQRHETIEPFWGRVYYQ